MVPTMAGEGLQGLDEVLAELRAGGEADSSGQFTLDRLKARGKLQKFQLVDARRYVLELVQAAVLRGATSVAFEIDADDLRMTFDGRAFTRAELAGLWDAIFADGEGADFRGLQELALGLNAALGIDPRSITVRSGGHALRVAAGQEDVLAPLDAAVTGTEIHVVQRRRLGSVVGFFRDLGGRLEEEVHLRTRCQHSPVHITLDRFPINQGFRVEGALVEQPIAAEGVRGVIAFTGTAAPTELRLLKDGVWIETVRLKRCGPGLVAIVSAEVLRKDVSLARIVADHGLQRVIEIVERERWGALARWIERAPFEQRGPRLDRRLRGEALAFMTLRAMTTWPDATRVAAAVRWIDARTDQRAPTRRVSLVDLANAVVLAADGSRTLHVATGLYRDLLPEGAPIACVVADDQAAVGRVLECRLVALDAELADQQARALTIKAWRQRVTPLTLPALRVYVARRRFVGDGVTGEIGLLAPVSEHSAAFSEVPTTWLIREGCLLTRLTTDWGVPGLDVAIEAMFTPSEGYDDAVRDETVVHAALLVLGALATVLSDVVRGTWFDTGAHALRLVKGWLLVALDGEAQAGLWQRLGVPADRWPDAATVARYVPVQTPLLWEGEALRELRELPLFADFDGAPRSLVELRGRFERLGELDEVDRAVAKVAGYGAGVLWLGEEERRILRGLFGGQALRSWTATLMAKRREEEFRAQPLGSMARAVRSLSEMVTEQGYDPGVWLRSVAGPGMIGVITFNLVEHAAAEALRRATIELWCSERPLVRKVFELGVGPIVGVVSATRLRPNHTWDDVVADDGLAEVTDALYAAAWSLLAGILRTGADPQRWVARMLLGRLAQADHADVVRALPDVMRWPVLATAARGWIDLTTIERVLGEFGVIPFVPTSTPQQPPTEPPVVCDSPGVVVLLRGLVGEGRVVPGEAVLRRIPLAGRIAGRPAISRVELDRSVVILWEALAGPPGIVGEVGLAETRTRGGLRLELCTDGRRIATVTVRDVAPAVEAIVADPLLSLTEDGSIDVLCPRFDEYVRLCRAAVPSLIESVKWRQLAVYGEELAHAQALEEAYEESLARAERPVAEEDVAAVKPPTLREIMALKRAGRAADDGAPEGPEHRLLAAIEGELAWARARHGELLERLRVDEASEQPGIAWYADGVALQRRHPLVARQLARLAAGKPADPIDVVFLASAVFTVMNAVAEAIVADDEQAFIAALAAKLALA
jgi:hypothetical protein